MSKTPANTNPVKATTAAEKTGAGPALAAHSKDAASSGKSGQDAKATAKKAK